MSAHFSTFLKLLFIRSFSSVSINLTDHNPNILCLFWFDLTKYNKLSFKFILLLYFSTSEIYGDPYKDDIPALPQEIITKAHGCYKYFYDTISSVHEFLIDTENLVVIISGSNKDEYHIEKLTKELKKENIL